ncbi:lipopolysaccharide assembly protein LapB [Parasulfuritortus cantonensis]|uniref:Lipopolysaccharide assembly protein B n=1 Tax=Parasulfuritortus cantonensis TaxID=2528202 RepID=A0A4R1B150_9PROT|nr:lipopolysaccharide assembly protein LapB [Parasulfuritortus cantonensis]TCJ11732.1 lipopolysaccharide assembly protein LapB [Parasulfuritortus cantonensis]
MEFETWQLLVLPFFFALGWLAARIDIRQVVKESRSIPTSYFRGLNYLLSEQPDRAIEAFLEVARLDPDTLELHFALGALFRRRGELDRAIRIHQNLVDRSDLKQDQRLKALYELGQDFLKAGLLDRAEDIFKKLETGVHVLDALRHQLEIYVLEKDWEAAIAVAQRLEKLGSPSQHADTSHYHCELALNAMLRKDVDAARAHLGEALAINRKAVRASQLLGDLAAQAGDDAGAIEHWRHIEQQNTAYLPVVAERLLKAYQRLGRLDDGIELIKGYLGRQPSADLFHILFNTVAEHRGWAEAEALAAETLKQLPSLRVLDDYLQARTSGTGNDLEIRMAQDLVHRQVSRVAYYQCGHCGFKARQFFWQCPACATWEGIPPERKENE